MSDWLAVVVPVVVFLLVQGLWLWERREFRDLGPLWVGWVAGGVVGGAALGEGRLAVLATLALRWPWAGTVVASVLVVLVIWLWARWPRVETPLDANWIGLAVGAGAALVTGVGGLGGWGEPWLPAAVLTAGALTGSLVALSWLSAAWWWRLSLLGVSLLSALSAPWGWAALSSHLGLSWVLWLGGGGVVLLASALAVRAEMKVLGPQLAEEVSLGLLPLWAAQRGSRFWGRFSRVWARRKDERKAMVRLVVRLAACKAYLAHHGKHRSTAAVELGRLRERARRLFGPSGARVES